MPRYCKAALYYHTARHLRPVQIVHRTRKTLGSALPFRAKELVLEKERYKLRKRSWAADALVCRRDEDGASERADQVVAGVFDFAGEVAGGDVTERWHVPERSRLWHFHLHYFDYAFDLALAWRRTGKEQYYRTFRDLVRSWLEHHRVHAGDGWHPYPTSLRAVNWALAYLLFQPLLANDDELRGLLLAATHAHGAFLSKNLEYDLLANHLLKNITALFILSRLYSDGEAEAWRRKADRLLKRELDQQILPDGCHFERSPMYHCIVLQDLLDILCFLEPEEKELRQKLERKVLAMLTFLETILHPDGTIPLFNDAALNMAPSPDELKGYARGVISCTPTEPEYSSREACPGIVHHRDSGYVVMECPSIKLVVDGGKLGPDCQLGHAHCDVFSYELSVGGKLLVVDSGTPTYEEGPLRTKCRSTQAHNTLMVDGEEQAEIWKSFRVGRRPELHGVESWCTDGVLCFHGWHDGYRRLRGHPIHRRQFFLLEHPALVVFDSVEGRGWHQAESYVHFHPDVEVDEEMLRLRVEDGVLTLLSLEGASVQLVEGFYAPRMGKVREAKALKLERSGSLPLHLAYVIAPENVRASNLCFEQHHQRLELRIAGKTRKIPLNGGCLWNRTMRKG